MPTVPIRYVCASRIVDLLRAHAQCVGVLVEPGWPGDRRVTAEMIWLDDISGNIDARLAMSGRKATDDTFTIPVLIRVAGPSLDAVQVRLAELMGAVHDVVVATASLESLDGVLSATPGPSEAMASVMETPSDGVLGYAIYPVTVHTRLA